MSEISIKTPVSRQRQYQLRQLAKGLCMLCASPLFTKSHCAKHAALFNTGVAARMRRKYGFQPWKPGGPGRPPKSAQQHEGGTP